MKGIIFAILLLPMTGHAEPGPPTRYLANERASLMDIGMVRLQALTTGFQKRAGLNWTDHGKPRFFRAEINALYEPEADRIHVCFTVMDSRPTEAQMAEGCTNAMSQLNNWLMKRLPGLFMHAGSDDPGKSALGKSGRQPNEDRQMENAQ